jgi:hypothetical protein
MCFSQDRGTPTQLACRGAPCGYPQIYSAMEIDLWVGVLNRKSLTRTDVILVRAGGLCIISPDFNRWHSIDPNQPDTVP